MTATTEDDLRKAAEIIYFVGEDSTTPIGHYSVTARVLGGVVEYLLNKQAKTIVGHVERMPNGVLVYAGGGIKGGRILLGNPDDLADANQRIVDAIKKEA